MTGTLWSGGGLPPDLDAYTVGEDRLWDRRLLPWDVYGTMAHAEGLWEIGLLDESEIGRLREALREALQAIRAGELTVGEADEDVHTALETYLTERLGELGQRVHAGRSRNDQVAADLRLYVKGRLFAVAESVLDLVEALADFARRWREVVLPGYTHQRRAMPSSWGLWAAGFAASLLEDIGPLRAALELADRSPLGSAAGYGVPLPLDRELVARLLGFAAPHRNATSAAAARGKLEVVVLAALWPLGYELAKLSWDVILFSSEEFGFLSLPASLATGSSIMPGKRNPDVFELTRARAGLLEGYLSQAMAVAGKLPSGYHRDLQLLKAPLMRGLDTAEEMLAMVTRALPLLEVDPTRCASALTGDLLATDEVFRRVREGEPFRRAYREVAAELRSGSMPPALTPEETLAARRFEGGAGNPGLAGVRRELRRQRRVLSRQRAAFAAALESLAERGGGVSS
jgi:argininosuccinate lyase